MKLKPEDFVGVEIIEVLGETSADTKYRAPHTSELKQMARIANLRLGFKEEVFKKWHCNSCHFETASDMDRCPVCNYGDWSEVHRKD